MAKEKIDEKGITARKAENFSEWYVQAIIRSEFLDYSDVSGCYIFRPAAYAAWQKIYDAVDPELRKLGVENVYFPVLIPEKFLSVEKDHIEGFAAEVAWVTHAGDTKLGERLAVRPTSEAMMYPTFAKWIRSWRDLPMRYNQWNSVLRWEFKDPTPFLRTREFLWNEGHSVFATEGEARGERDQILNLYVRILKEYLALPGIVGRKTEKEKFAGAVESYSIEHVMPDGYGVQGPAFHFDGQKFARSFEIKFLDAEGKSSYAWQNTYAISTRELGVMVATHGDDKGLVIPPKLAHIQVVVVPIYKNENKETVMEFAGKAVKLLGEEVRVRLDDREGYSPGFKFNEWEMKGVPIRIEIGPKDVEKRQVVLVRRDTGAKSETDLGNLSEKVNLLLNEIHKALYLKAEKFLHDNVHTAKDYDSLKKILKEKGGLVSAPWCEDQECEEKIKAETGAKITNMPLGQGKVDAKCVYCKKKAKTMANFAKSY
ncbi:MAG: proline--tRNA ligase [Candidatus Micrarchaeota archaeon]|nr:proline--tRNA ligase [Candidatus Micrarchaeota archaeon]